MNTGDRILEFTDRIDELEESLQLLVLSSVMYRDDEKYLEIMEKTRVLLKDIKDDTEIVDDVKNTMYLLVSTLFERALDDLHNLHEAREYIVDELDSEGGEE